MLKEKRVENLTIFNPFLFGAAEESRTLDLYLGKVSLYQLSYCRKSGFYLRNTYTEQRTLYKHSFVNKTKYPQRRLGTPCHPQRNERYHDIRPRIKRTLEFSKFLRLGTTANAQGHALKLYFHSLPSAYNAESARQRTQVEISLPCRMQADLEWHTKWHTRKSTNEQLHSYSSCYIQSMAEAVRFELTEDLHPRQFSRLMHSTTLPSLRLSPPKNFHYRGLNPAPLPHIEACRPWWKRSHP